MQLKESIRIVLFLILANTSIWIPIFNNNDVRKIGFAAATELQLDANLYGSLSVEDIQSTMSSLYNARLRTERSLQHDPIAQIAEEMSEDYRYCSFLKQPELDFIYDNRTDFARELNFAPNDYNCGKKFDVIRLLNLVQKYSKLKQFTVGVDSRNLLVTPRTGASNSNSNGGSSATSGRVANQEASTMIGKDLMKKNEITTVKSAYKLWSSWYPPSLTTEASKKQPAPENRLKITPKQPQLAQYKSTKTPSLADDLKNLKAMKPFKPKKYDYLKLESNSSVQKNRISKEHAKPAITNNLLANQQQLQQQLVNSNGNQQLSANHLSDKVLNNYPQPAAKHSESVANSLDLLNNANNRRNEMRFAPPNIHQAIVPPGAGMVPSHH